MLSIDSQCKDGARPVLIIEEKYLFLKRIPAKMLVFGIRYSLMYLPAQKWVFIFCKCWFLLASAIFYVLTNDG